MGRQELHYLASIGVAVVLSGLVSGCGLRTGNADAVLGQPDLTSNAVNNQTLVPGARLRDPIGVGIHLFPSYDPYLSVERLYVADTNNNRVLSWPSARAFANGETADVVLGQQDMNGTQPNEGNQAPTLGSLKGPFGVTVDSAGNVYVADTGNDRVLMYKAPISTHQAAAMVFGGDLGGVLEGGLSGPKAVAICPDPAGTHPALCVADTLHNRIIGYDIQNATLAWVIGQIDFKAQQANEGQASPSPRSLWAPTGMAVSTNGDLYVADNLNNRVLRFSAPLMTHMAADLVLGQQDFTHGQPNQGGALPNGSTLYFPWGVALDPGGNLYVGDNSNNRVLRYLSPLSTGMTTSLALGQPVFAQGTANTGGVSAKSLWNPHGVTVDSTANLIVADTYNNRVLRYTYFHVAYDNIPDVVYSGGGGDGCTTPSATAFCGLAGAAVDLKSGRLFVVDFYNKRVLSWPDLNAIDNGAPPDAVIGAPDFNKRGVGVSAATLGNPYAVVVDSGGNLWVSDRDNNRVLRFPGPFANVKGPVADLVLGQASFTGSQPNHGGVVDQSGFDQPWGLAVDINNDTLYVADSNNNRILQFGKNLQGNPPLAERVIGQPNFTTNWTNFGAGATSNSAGYSHPFGLAVSGADLFVADFDNNRVVDVDLKANPAKDKVVLGQPDFINLSQANQGRNSPDATTLALPITLAFDPFHLVLYVSDLSVNNRLLQYRLPIANGQPADKVFGQQDFTTSYAQWWLGGFKNAGAGCVAPVGLATDSTGNLVAVDGCSDTIMKYDLPVK